MLLLDIDGPLNPFEAHTLPDSFACGGTWNRGRFQILTLADRFSHLVSLGVTPVWVSAWQEESHALEVVLGLPENMEVIDLDIETPLGRGTWKLPAVKAWSAKHSSVPLIWIDDELGEDAYTWAAQRGHTLLVRSSPRLGWTEDEYRQVVSFVNQYRQ